VYFVELLHAKLTYSVGKVSRESLQAASCWLLCKQKDSVVVVLLIHLGSLSFPLDKGLVLATNSEEALRV
jgi:hypothetical protein